MTKQQIRKDAEAVRGEEIAQGSAPMCPICNAPVSPACNCARGIDAAEAKDVPLKQIRKDADSAQ